MIRESQRNRVANLLFVVYLVEASENVINWAAFLRERNFYCQSLDLCVHKIVSDVSCSPTAGLPQSPLHKKKMDRNREGGTKCTIAANANLLKTAKRSWINSVSLKLVLPWPFCLQKTKPETALKIKQWKDKFGKRWRPGSQILTFRKITQNWVDRVGGPTGAGLHRANLFQDERGAGFLFFFSRKTGLSNSETNSRKEKSRELIVNHSFKVSLFLLG